MAESVLVSLLISTYESPDALATVLRSVSNQSQAPYEVVVGDDGSGPETAEVIEQARSRGLTIHHQWLPHDGFRLARGRNNAAVRATGDYLVIIDGDILLHRDFVKDHAQSAERGFFVQGTRVLLDEEETEKAMTIDGFWPSIFSPGVGNAKNLIRSPRLSSLFSGEAAGLKGIRTCNFAVWRDDYVRVNGFNEDFVGWGREDSEFVTRLFNAGVRRKNLRFLALGCHLYHPPRSREGVSDNDALLAEAMDANASWCERGLNLHIKDGTDVQK